MTAAATRAYGVLVDRIAAGTLPPGAFLVESDLAREIGVSRTPVREAIKRLAAEGLVEVQDRRRAQVREFGEAKVYELFELRARLEGYAAWRAATRIDAAGLARLGELAARMEAAVASRAPDAAATFATLNDEFHQVILEAADAEHLAMALRPVLQIQLVMLARYRETIVEHLERSCWHHRELLRALELRDPELAEMQMKLHLLAARRTRGGIDQGGDQ